MTKLTEAEEVDALVEADERGLKVRLPPDFFRPGDWVRIRREGDRVVIEPAPAPPPAASAGSVPRHVHPGWPPGFWEELRALGPVSDEFVAAVREAREQWVESPERERMIEDYVRWADAQDAEAERQRSAGHGETPPAPAGDA